MPKNNFSFEKRRKELAKKAKKEEKKNRKTEGGDSPPADTEAEGTSTAETPAAEKSDPGI